MSKFVLSLAGNDIVSGSSVVVLLPNVSRRAVIITNGSASYIWIAKGLTVSIGSGIMLNPLGGSYIDEVDAMGSIYTGPYAAIAVTTGVNVLGHVEDIYEAE